MYIVLALSTRMSKAFSHRLLRHSVWLWLYLAWSGRFLQIKLQPLGAALRVQSYSTVRS